MKTVLNINEKNNIRLLTLALYKKLVKQKIEIGYGDLSDILYECVGDILMYKENQE